MPPGHRPLISENMLKNLAVLLLGYTIAAVPSVLVVLIFGATLFQIFETLTIAAMIYFPTMFVVYLWTQFSNTKNRKIKSILSITAIIAICVVVILVFLLMVPLQPYFAAPPS
jgi:hypothetical protein